MAGQQVGPMGRAELTGRLGSGEYGPDTLVWRAGMPDWVAASAVPELAPGDDTKPPALPGQ